MHACANRLLLFCYEQYKPVWTIWAGAVGSGGKGVRCLMAVKWVWMAHRPQEQ